VHTRFFVVVHFCFHSSSCKYCRFIFCRPFLALCFVIIIICNNYHGDKRQADRSLLCCIFACRLPSSVHLSIHGGDWNCKTWNWKWQYLKNDAPNCRAGKCIHGGPPKIGTLFVYALTLPNIKRFSKLFRCQNRDKICNNTITKDPTTPQVCCYTTLWNISVLKATIENIGHWRRRLELVS